MEGAAFFREMLAEYAIADAGGLSVLCRAAECVDRMAAARASIAKDGEIIQNQYNVPKLNPACVLEKQARDGFYAAMRLLSLDIEAPEPRAYRPWEPRQGAEAPW